MSWALAMLLAVLGVLSLAAETSAAPLLVDCTRPTTDLQRRILVSLRPLELRIKGECRENLVIGRDDVILTSDPTVPGSITSADPNRDAVTIDGGRRIVIDGLKITGGVRGVAAVRGASLEIRNCEVTGASVIGIASVTGSTVTVLDCAIHHNLREGVTTANNASTFITGGSVTNNGRHGIVAIRSGHVGVTAVTVASNVGTGIIVTNSSVGVIVQSTITQNTGTGIAVQHGSSSRIGIDAGGDSSAQGNTVGSNSGSGILVESASVTGAGNTISNNVINGIELYNGGVLDLQSSAVTGHSTGILATLNSSLRLRNGTSVSNGGTGIILFRQSVLELRSVSFPPVVTVTGNASLGLSCSGGSQYSNDTADANVFSGNNGGGQQVSCSPF